MTLEIGPEISIDRHEPLIQWVINLLIYFLLVTILYLMYFENPLELDHV